MNIQELIEAVKEIKQAVKDAEPAMLYYAGTTTGDAISKLIEYVTGSIESFEDKIGGKIE